MAEALFRRALKARGEEGISVASAGTGAWDDAPASEGAYLVALESGVDLSAHRARTLTAAIVRDADLILTMSSQHRARVEALGGAGRVYTLAEYAGLRGQSGGDISDPFGGDIEGYRRTWHQLEQLVESAASRMAAER